MSHIFNNFQLLDLINLDETMWENTHTNLIIADAVHALTSENLTLELGATVLDIQNASHPLSSENITLIQTHVLAIANAIHSLTSNNISLTQAHLLVIANAVHSLSSDNISLSWDIGDDALYRVTAMEHLIRTILNEPSTAILSSAEILNALNDGYKNVALLGGCVERLDSVVTVPNSRIIPFSGHKVNFVHFAQGSYLLSTVLPPTGGTITTYEGYTIHTFLVDGIFRTYKDIMVAYMVVGGGGGGGKTASFGSTQGGGGGAGGFLTAEGLYVPAGSYPISIGAGGVGHHSSGQGGDGGNTNFYSVTAIGGGGGGGSDADGDGSGPEKNGRNGGSSGGSTWDGVSPEPVQSPVQGHKGSNGYGVYERGGGGGGATGDGDSVGDGGMGFQDRVNGTSLQIAGGGGGGALGVANPPVGNSGGGNGGIMNIARDATNGVPNTGGGGGGGTSDDVGGLAGDGGSGVVRIWYLTIPA